MVHCHRFMLILLMIESSGSVDEVHKKDHYMCLTLKLGNFTDESDDAIWQPFQQHQTLQISPGFLQHDNDLLSSFMKRHLVCLIAFVTEHDLLPMAIILLKSVEQHLIIYEGKIRPSNTILTKEDRPIVMPIKKINQRNKLYVLTEVYCPKENMLTVARTKQILLPELIPEKLYRITRNGSIICPNPFLNQNLYGSSSTGRIVRNGVLVGGYHVSLFWYLGEKFKFNAVSKAEASSYDQKNRSFNGRNKKVLDREYLMSTGAVVNLFYSNFDYMPSHNSYRITFASRIARPIDSYGNMFLPFSFGLWFATLLTGLFFSFSFYAIYLAYERQSVLVSQGLHRKENFKINFLLYAMSKITEPDPLPWFSQKWSAGKLLTFLWSFWGFFMVMCYNSNLRAYLTSPKYEKSLNTIQDVADNNKIAWLPVNLVRAQPWYLEATGQTKSPLYKISTQASRIGSLYDSAKHGGVSAQAVQDALNKRGTFLVIRDNLPQIQYRLKDTLKGKKFYLAKEDVLVSPSCFVLRKHHYMRREMHSAISTAIEFGLTIKWTNDFLPAEFVLSQSLVRKESQSEEKKTLRPLKLQHVIIMFLLYSVALSLASIVFTLENKKKTQSWRTLKLCKFR